MPNRYLVQLALMALLALAASPAHAAEAITSFVHNITVNADGSLDVREEITVRAEGQSINHGIERDFPVRFSDYSGGRRTTSFELSSVTRDGKDEPYELIPIDNGVRVRVGSGSVTLKPGQHKYVLTYQTDNQVYSEAGRDILYWNVTGNGWELPIEKASAVVHYPRALKPDEVKLESYSGMTGSSVTSNSTQAQREGLSYFESTKPLPQGWGLTIVSILPKGVLSLPEVAAKSVPGVNGVGPAGGSGARGGQGGGGAAPGGPAVQALGGIPTMVWVLIIIVVVMSLMGGRRSGCGGCGCLPIPIPFGCFPGPGGCGPGGGFGGGGFGGGGYGGGGGGFGRGGGGFSGGGRSGGGGSFGGGSSGGGGGGGGGRGW